MTELIRTLGAFSEVPGPEHGRMAAALGLERAPTRAEHTDLFLLQLHPYASVHLGPEGMLGGEGRDRVAGFWRALQLTPPTEPDHLATLLGLYATLREGEARQESERGRAVGLRARAALLGEHVASWVFPWLDGVMGVAADPYRGWARILRAALLGELREVGVFRELPLHLREAPPLSDPREGNGDFLAELLAPVRTGMIVTRADLIRAGRECGLGVRIGERRYTLEALVGQEPGAVFRWLEGEARAWARRHRRLEEELGPTGVFWRERAETTGRLLGKLARDPVPPSPTPQEKTHA